MIVIWIVIAVIGAYYLWRLDVRHHPYRPCSRCGGKRVNPGSSSSRWGLCRKCGGRGAVRRYGAPNDSSRGPRE